MVRRPLDDVKTWLAEMRKGTARLNVEWTVAHIREILEQVNATLQMVGTNEAELKQLVVLNYVADAKEQIRALRERRFPASAGWSIVTRIEQDAERAGVTLGRLGTSQKELRELVLNREP